MKYELISVDDTGILKMENGETLFLNETATFIIKRYEEGLNNKEIYECICKEYNIKKEDEDVIIKQIKKMISEIEKYK